MINYCSSPCYISIPLSWAPTQHSWLYYFSSTWQCIQFRKSSRKPDPNAMFKAKPCVYKRRWWTLSGVEDMGMTLNKDFNSFCITTDIGVNDGLVLHQQLIVIYLLVCHPPLSWGWIVCIQESEVYVLSDASLGSYSPTYDDPMLWLGWVKN